MPNSTDQKKKSATPLEVTLSKLTATDLVTIGLATNVAPSEVLSSLIQKSAWVNA